MSYSKKIHYQRLLEVEDDDGWIVNEDGQPHDSPHHQQDEEQQLVMIIDQKAVNDCIIPDHHINLSLIGCVLFFPIGICAVMKSLKIQDYYDRGELMKAKEISRQTETLAKRAITIGCLLILCVFLFIASISLIVVALFKPKDYY